MPTRELMDKLDEAEHEERELGLGSMFGDDSPTNPMEEFVAKAAEAKAYFDTREKDENYDFGILRVLLNEAEFLLDRARREYGG